jgi:hypothetical protein
MLIYESKPSEELVKFHSLLNEEQNKKGSPLTLIEFENILIGTGITYYNFNMEELIKKMEYYSMITRGKSWIIVLDFFIVS